jgi:hypothetical protein
MLALIQGVNEMNIYQKIVPTGTPGIRQATSKLKKAGYKVNTSSLGPQVTESGLVNSTMINVYFDDNANDTDRVRVKNMIQIVDERYEKWD